MLRTLHRWLVPALVVATTLSLAVVAVATSYTPSYYAGGYYVY